MKFVFIRNFKKIIRKMKNKHKRILVALLTIAGALFSFSAYGESDEATENLISITSQDLPSSKDFQRLLPEVQANNNTFYPNPSHGIFISSEDMAVIDILSEAKEDRQKVDKRSLKLLGLFKSLKQKAVEGYDYLAEGLEEIKGIIIGEKEGGNSKVAEGKRGENITIAIIDIDKPGANHPSFNAQKVWINTDEIPSDGIDNDKNGYTDDVYGWNFGWRNNNAIINELCLTNTHSVKCANCALEIASESKIMYLDVDSHLNLGINIKGTHNNLSTPDLDISAAIIYATDNGAKVISVSFGSLDYVFETQKAIDYAYSKDVIITAAVGNSDTEIPYYPAAYNNVTTVAGLVSGKRWPDSNYGNCVDIAASADFETNKGIIEKLFSLSGDCGTSLSAPRVAGTAAFLRSENPSLNATQITNILYNTADDIEPAGWDPYTGYGELNLTAALQVLRSLSNLNSSERNLVLNQPPQKHL